MVEKFINSKFTFGYASKTYYEYRKVTLDIGETYVEPPQ